ncbi:MAG: heparan-alpha-glucosaminide N-acetyltransferase [Methanoregulaceae archaeon]|jgi:uncharacterized membrane protein
MKNPYQLTDVNGRGRFEEIDMVRGIAILMMIIFHTLFDLYFFGLYPIDVTTGFWRYFAFTIASLFLLIVGISLIISHARAVQNISKDNESESIKILLKYFKRGAGIFGCGLLVTVATWFYLGEGFVIFGILHLIGLSIILAPFFFRFKKNNVLIGVLCIIIGIVLTSSGMNGSIFSLWLGIPPAPFYSVDYTPLFPWFGVVLIGMGIGEQLYPNGKRSFSMPNVPEKLISPFAFLGRHSLIIYLIHQPILITILHIFTGVPLFG